MKDRKGKERKAATHFIENSNLTILDVLVKIETYSGRSSRQLNKSEPAIGN